MGAEVDFCIVNGARNAGVKHATRVVVVKLPPKKKQLGIVIMVKSNFGFIKCQERQEDIFFHFTAVEVCVVLLTLIQHERHEQGDGALIACDY